MKLKEKFSDTLYDVKISNEVAINEFVKITNNYAIEFGQWVQFHSELWIKYKTEELLLMFEKEKGW